MEEIKKAKTKNCPNCNLYNMGRLNVYKPDEPRSCKAGNSKAMEAWWSENGHKVDKSTLTELPCFEETELGNILNKAGELLDELKKINEANKWQE